MLVLSVTRVTIVLGPNTDRAERACALMLSLGRPTIGLDPG